MSRLYALMASPEAVAAQFGAELVEGTASTEMVEGNVGWVVFEAGDRRRLKPMTWGFPRPTIAAPNGRIGLVADLTNPMWDKLVVDTRYRCLIPLTHFANPEGEPGAKMRTWFSVKDQPIVAWAGFCRNIPSVGPVFGGMTMEANKAIPPTNERMPVLLMPHEYKLWLHGSIEDVISFQFRPPVAAEKKVVERTSDRWRSGKLPIVPSPQLGLL